MLQSPTRRRAPSPSRRGLCAAPLLLALCGCESTPGIGAETRATVLAVPQSRQSLGGLYSYMHAALRSGVTRTEVASGRLVRGECAEPDPTQPGGTAWRTITTLLPPGFTVPPNALVEVTTDDGSTRTAGTGSARHGAFVGIGPALDETSGIHADPVSGANGPLRARCHPPGVPSGVARVALRGSIPAWQYDFASAELARHAQFTDSDLASGRVLQVSCQLKVADGGDWHAPVWLARAPAGSRFSAGDVVRLRAGALESSKDAEPVAEVIAMAKPSNVAAPGGLARCY